MGFFDFFKSDSSKNKDVTTDSALYIGNGRVGYNPILNDTFDGEKTPGELGAVYDTYPDFIRLRLRAYDMNLKTDIIKIITGKFFKWVIGKGLKLQAEPNENVLKLSGITEDTTKLQESAEALFNLYASTKYCDYSGRQNLHKKAQEAYKTAFLGGDCLCVIRVSDFGPNVQVVDGQQLSSPLDDSKKGKNNFIKDGIELNSKGEHVAFWVLKEVENDIAVHVRIKAKNSNGNLVAWMIYGDKARIDHHRGIPVISSILEKVAKLDRFVEASVKKAEETANVVYAFKHQPNSTGENILTSSLSSRRKNDDEKEETIYEKNGKTAQSLRQSTNGTVMNLTPDSDLISLSNESETSFDVFFRAVFVSLCAAVDIPEEVALQKYEQNYSSSRAAINGWEFIVEIHREEFSNDFYKNFYNIWFEWQVLTNKIKSTGFTKAKKENDFMAVEAFLSCKFLGKKMPHIDPLKEAKAIRLMLGNDTTPLINHEQAVDAWGSGDWSENFKKYLKEKELIPKELLENKEDDKNKIDGSKPKLESKPKK